MERQTLATVAASGATGGEPTMVISTIALDRDRDVIVPEGGEFGPYLRNPVVGFQHFRTDPLPIGSTIRLDVEPGKGIRATWRWLKNDPLADRVRNAYQQEILRAASIGFIPVEWRDIPETGGRKYTKWELTEWSLVALPSNRQAVRTLKSLDLWPKDEDDIYLEVSDDPDSFEVDPVEVAAAIRQVLPEIVRNAVAANVGRATELALDKFRGRIADAAFDPDVCRLRRAAVRREIVDVDEEAVRSAFREIQPELRESIRELALRAVRRARGIVE